MKVYLVDGTFELFRAFYSKAPAHVTPDGFQAKATVGLIRSMLALLHNKTGSIPAELKSHYTPVIWPSKP